VSGKREADDGRFLLPARQGGRVKEREREREKEREGEEREREREGEREADGWWTKTKGDGGKKRRNIEQEKVRPTGEGIREERCCSSSALCMVQCGAVLKGERMAWMDFACVSP